MGNEPTDPHDRFARLLLSDPVRMAEFWADYLPGDLGRRIHLRNLIRAEDTWIDPELSRSLSDIVYRGELVDAAGRAGSAFLYILIDHKSSPNAFVEFQLLRYMVRIWEACRRADASGPLPIIVPVVLYHGERRWTASTGFESLFGGDVPPDLQPIVPSFRHELVDLTVRDDAELGGGPELRAGMRLLHGVYRDDFGKRMVAAVIELSSTGG